MVYQAVRYASDLTKTRGDWKYDTQQKRPAVAPGPVRSPLLALPGEIRNRIYDFLFNKPILVEIISNTSKPETYPEKVKRNVRDWQILHFKTSVGRPQPDQTSASAQTSGFGNSGLGLILTCRRLNDELSCFVYSRSSFLFHSAAKLVQFLNIIRPGVLACIRELHFHHTTYGHPKFPQNATWRTQHVQNLERTIDRCCKNMYNLRHLHLDLYVAEKPLHFRLDEQWVVPLIRFSKLTLETVNIHISKGDDDPDFAGEALRFLRRNFSRSLELKILNRLVAGTDKFHIALEAFTDDERAFIDYIVLG